MYKIGEVSKITKISTRMLRYYDEENLLKPSFTGSNGYRFYTDSDLDIIEKIKHLRRYHFSYNEMRDILLNKQENDTTIYLQKLNELKNTATDYDLLISELESAHQVGTPSPITNSYDIHFVEKQPFYGLCKKKILKEDKIDAFIDQMASKVFKSRLSLLGNSFITFCDSSLLDEGDFEIEYCQPITSHDSIKGFETKLFETPLYLSTLHYGDYSHVSKAYSQLYKWADQKGFKMIGDFMEKYYVDSYFTPDCNEFITEISVAICKF